MKQGNNVYMGLPKVVEMHVALLEGFAGGEMEVTGDLIDLELALEATALTLLRRFDISLTVLVFVSLFQTSRCSFIHNNIGLDIKGHKHFFVNSRIGLGNACESKMKVRT